jgi:23S rRNA (adenine2030-N6)-methyltransferase
MNYRHIFHAGSFADVFKHIILIGLIRTLGKKETPYCYIDTHAGIGCYDLLSDTAQKTREFAQGVEKLLTLPKTHLPEWATDYLKIIESINPAKELRYYPGSPRIVRALLRPQDRMILSELHKEDVQVLKQEFKNDTQVAAHHMNGYPALKAFLPPQERRGLVLIDPAYEVADEFERIIAALEVAMQRWNTGIYAIWYPIKDRALINNFYRRLKYSGIQKILCSELSVQDEIASGLNACGMIIVNPPWKFDQEMSAAVKWLWSVLSSGQQGEYRTEWLVTE